MVSLCFVVSCCIAILSGIKYYNIKNSYEQYSSISHQVTGHVVSHHKETNKELTHYYITFEFALPIYGFSRKRMTLSTTCRNNAKMNECTRIMENIFAKESAYVDLIYVDTQPDPSIHLHNDNPYYVLMLDWQHTAKSSIVMSFVTLYILMTIAIIYWGKIQKSIYPVILTNCIVIILAVCIYVSANHSYNKNYSEWATQQIDLTIKSVNKRVVETDRYVHPRDSKRMSKSGQVTIFEFEFEDHGNFHAYHHVSVPIATIKCPNRFFTHHFHKNMEECIQHYERYFKVGNLVHAYFNRFDDQIVYINEEISITSAINGSILIMICILSIALVMSTAFTGSMSYNEIKKGN
jgi:hypothetical protein